MFLIVVDIKCYSARTTIISTLYTILFIVTILHCTALHYTIILLLTIGAIISKFLLDIIFVLFAAIAVS
jgi:hypothetical protein